MNKVAEGLTGWPLEEARSMPCEAIFQIINEESRQVVESPVIKVMREGDDHLYSLMCPLMLGIILVTIPKYAKGKLPLVAKNKEGQPLKSKVEALDDPRNDTPDLLGKKPQIALPPGT